MLALLIVTVIVSLVTIVFGELVPKTLALGHAERYALTLARPVEVLGAILSPVVWFLTTLTHAITRVFGVRDIADDAITTEELRILVERGGELGTIEAEEEQMIGGILELGERRVHEVMVARVDMVALKVDAALGEIVETIVSEGHSRYPGLRRQYRQHRGHALREGPVAVPGRGGPATFHPPTRADSVVRA